MIFPRLAEKVVAQTLDGASNATATSGWVDAGTCRGIAITGVAGNLGAGASVVISAEQAQDSSGTGAKALTANGFAAQTLDADNESGELYGTTNLLDMAGGFRYVRAKATSAVGDAPVSIFVFKVEPRNYTAANPSTD